MPTFGQLQQTHPDYDRSGWTQLKLMADGGLRLLDAVRNPEDHGIPEGEELLVRRMGEGAIYDERKRRAFVLPNTPHILGFFSASTLSDPPAVKEKVEEAPAPAVPADEPDEPADPIESPAAVAPPDKEPVVPGEDADPQEPLAQTDEPTWYEMFQEDVDRHGTDLPEFMRRRLVDALTLKSGFVFVDFPEAPEDAVIQSLLDEEQAGLTDGYLCPVDRMQVLDWERDESGSFVWAKVLTITTPLDDPLAPRKIKRYEWRILRAASKADAVEPVAGDDGPAAVATVERYRIDWDTTKSPEPPEQHPAADVGITSMRYADFPLVELTVPDGLWVAAKVFSAELQLLNKRNGKAWSEDITAFKFLIAKLRDVEMPLPRQFGDGAVKVVSLDEDIEWRGAPHEDIATLRDTCRELTEEIHRVANALALAAPLGAIQQAASGEAKRRDNKPSTIVCRALAQLVRDAIQQVFDRLAEGRGEDLEFEVSGLQRFDEDTQILDMVLAGIDTKIMSDSAVVEIQKRAVDELLDDLPPTLKAEIYGELEERATQKRAKRDALAQVTIDNPEAMVAGAAGASAAPPAALPAMGQ